MLEMTPAQFKATIAELYETVESLRSQLTARDKQIAAEKQKAGDMAARYSASEVASTFGRIAVSMGSPPDALTDVIGRATAAGWVANESGELELRNPKTGAIVYDSSGMQYTPESWAAEQARGNAGYLFRGGNAQAGGGSGGGGVEGGANPWANATWSDEKQVEIFRANPQRAEQLAKAAGSYVGALPPGLGKKRAY